MARNIITGIDAGSSMIRVITAEQKNGGGLNILGANQKQSEGIRRGYIVNLEDAAKSISEAVKGAEKIAGFPIKKAVISIGGISLSSCKSKDAIMISRPDGEITDYDVKRLISQCEDNLRNISNKHIVHTVPLRFKIDSSPVLGKPAGMKGTKLEVETMFVTCLNQHLNDLVKTVESAGISVEDIVSSPLAMSHTVLTKYQKEVGCVLANIGASTVSVVVFEEGLPISLEVFPIGSTHITNDIALGLQIPLEEAEKLKIGYGSDISSAPKRKLSDIIDARLNDIFEIIESHLKKINRNEMLPAGIIMTGGGSSLFSLEEIAKASLKLPSRIGTFSTKGHNNHSTNITASSNNLKELIFNNPGWSVALGLCINNLNENFICDNCSSGKAEKKIGQRVGQIIKSCISSILP